MIRSKALWVLAAAISIGCTACGYHVGGTADTMPKTLRTIAIPAFATITTRYRLVDELPEDIGREFRARTRYAIVTDTTGADAVLNGTINSSLIYPSIFDPASGKATSVQIVVNLTISLTDEKTGKVLYSRPNFVVRQSYQIAVDPHQFFNESSPALDRLSREVAHDVVSSVVENF